MIVAVASGKGGTGKTTISLNLAKVYGDPIRLLDCDVEEPNCHLFLKGWDRDEAIVSIPIPQVDEKQCNACGECSKVCRFHAIAALGTKPLVFPELCHGCGGCAMICPQKAIGEVEKRIGTVRSLQAGNITLIQGTLEIGVGMAPPLIRAVKARLPKDQPAILDAPPGTSCPVIAAIRGADFVILVTEPTPFGMHDLKLAIDMVRELKLPLGVVVNRMGAGDDRVHVFCKEAGVPVLLEIPDDRRIAETYSRGILMVDALPEYRGLFKQLVRGVIENQTKRAVEP